MDLKIDKKLDCKGLSCPMPMMKLAKTIKSMRPGETLEMLGTDPGTKSDLPRWCAKSGNSLLEVSELSGGVSRFLIKKE